MLRDALIRRAERTLQGGIHMATDAAFMEYVAEQLSEAGVVTYRKMPTELWG